MLHEEPLGPPLLVLLADELLDGPLVTEAIGVWEARHGRLGALWLCHNHHSRHAERWAQRHDVPRATNPSLLNVVRDAERLNGGVIVLHFGNATGRKLVKLAEQYDLRVVDMHVPTARG